MKGLECFLYQGLDFGQNLAGERTYCCLKESHFPLIKFHLISKGSQMSNDLGENHLLKRPSDLSSLNIVRLDFEIKRNPHNRFHNEIFKIVSAFVLKDSSGLEKIPTEQTRDNHPGSSFVKSIVSC